MNIKWIVAGILAILALAAIGYAGITAYIAYSLTILNPSPITVDKHTIGDRAADVVFRSTDNTQLAGWFFPGTNGKAIMFVPGAGQNRTNIDYGGTEIAKHFVEEGYSVLLFDLRGTGESQVTRQSFGQYEKNDVAGAFQYLVKQEYAPESIGIVSDSLGAISTIMASREIKDAGAVVLDSPATEVVTAISHLMEGEHNIPRFLHPGVYFWAKTLYGIDALSVRPVDQIYYLENTPLLFLHGAKDDLIPPFNSEQLLSKVKKGTRVVFPNSDHVHTYKSDHALYLDTVSTFFTNNLK